MKRILCILLAVVMLIGIFPVISATAATQNTAFPSQEEFLSYFSQVKDSKYIEELSTCTDVQLAPLIAEGVQGAKETDYFLQMSLKNPGTTRTYAQMKSADLKTAITKEITKAKFVNLLWQIASRPSVPMAVNYNPDTHTYTYSEITLPFTDTKNLDSNTLLAIKWMYGNQIETGNSETEFGANDLITLSEAAKILKKYFEFANASFIRTPDQIDTTYINSCNITEEEKEAMIWAVENGVFDNIAVEGKLQNGITQGMLAIMINNISKNTRKELFAYKTSYANSDAAKDYLNLIGAKMDYTSTRPADLSDYEKYVVQYEPETTWGSKIRNRRTGSIAYTTMMYLFWEYDIATLTTYAEVDNSGLNIYIKKTTDSLTDEVKSQYCFSPDGVEDQFARAYATGLLRALNQAATTGITATAPIPVYYDFVINNRTNLPCDMGDLTIGTSLGHFFTSATDLPKLYYIKVYADEAAEVLEKRAAADAQLDEIAAQIPDASNNIDQLNAIARYIQDNFGREKPDGDRNLLTILEYQSGVCHETTILFQALAAKKGIKVDYCVGTLMGNAHAWAKYTDGVNALYYDVLNWKYGPVTSDVWTKYSYVLNACMEDMLVLEERNTVTTSDLVVASASLCLDEDIDIIYKGIVESGYTDIYMEFVMNEEGNINSYVNNCPNPFKIIRVQDDGTHKFVFEGITPQCMADTVTATLYATKNGVQYASKPVQYSVRTYCVRKLASDTISPELRTLLSDLLAYGTAAQKYTGYVPYKTYVTSGNDIINPTYSTFVQQSGLSASFIGTASNDIAWTGANLTLSNSVAMNFKFQAEDISNLTIKVKIEDREETFTEFTPVEGNIYEISFAGIKAVEFGETVQASFYRSGKQVGNTICYSVNTYVCAQQNSTNSTLRNLIRALYLYGDSAVAYKNSVQ